MSYQKFLIKTETNQIPKFQEKINLSGLKNFIYLTGYYKPKYSSDFVYLVMTGDIRYGACIVLEGYKFSPIDEIFDFEEIMINSGNYEFIKITEKEQEV